MGHHHGNQTRAAAIHPSAAEAAPWGWIIANATVFTSSACIMVIELVAGRIISRHLGSSVYTWTSVIGIVLAGIAVGNYLGGLLADRYSSKKTLAKMFMCAAAAAAAITMLDRVAESWSFLWMLPWPVRVASHVAITFFLPTAVLGMISPIIAKMALDLGREKGRTIGDIYAWGVTGSIVGTFLAGFYLIAALGTQGVVWSVAGVLAIMAILYWPKTWKTWAAATAVALLASLATGSSQRARDWGESLLLREHRLDNVLYEKESAYSHIAILQITKEPDVREMYLDTLLHSQIDMHDITNLSYEYERIYAAVTHRLRPDAAHVDSLTIGGGGYVYPRYMASQYPGSRTDVAEIDPGVTRAAIKYFGLTDDGSIHFYHGDGRVLIEQMLAKQHSPDAAKPYDFIYCDVFNDYNVPYQLATLEFMQNARGLIKPHGAYLMNAIDIFSSGRFLSSLITTMKKVFPHVYVLIEGEGVAKSGDNRDTFILVGMNEALSTTNIGSEYRPDCQIYALTEDDLADISSRNKPLVLTDEYAPVENLLEAVVKNAAKFKAVDAWVVKAQLAMNAKDYNRAVEIAENALERFSGSRPLMNVLAQSQLLKGNVTDAIGTLRHALSLQPKYILAHVGLVECYLHVNQPEKALPHYRTILDAYPTAPKVRYNYGVTLLDMGRNEEAIKQFEIVARLLPTFANNYNNWGAALYRMGDTPGAIEKLQQAVELNPKHLDASANLGALLAYTKQYKKAADTYLAYLKQKPDDANVHYNLGEAYFAMANTPEALRCYETAIKIEPEFVRGIFGKAKALARLGRLEEAKQAYRRVLKLNPTIQEAEQAIKDIDQKLRQTTATMPATDHP